MLDDTSDLADAHKMDRVAYLKMGALHGVTVEVEAPLDDTGDVPALVQQGLVIRCLIPRGTDLETLRLSLAGGAAGRLVQTVLSGHELSLTPEGGTGRLTRTAQRAREQLLRTLDGLGKAASAVSWPAVLPTHAGLPEAGLHH